jgi:hypothetical protein
VCASLRCAACVVLLLRPMVANVLEGFNVTIFACTQPLFASGLFARACVEAVWRGGWCGDRYSDGQTGSGKTHVCNAQPPERFGLACAGVARARTL